MKKNKKKLEQLTKKVMRYADILGVSRLVGNVIIDKTIENEAEVGLSVYNDICDITFREYNTIYIIHELLHLAFKNTFNFMEDNDNENLKNVFWMIHEQEIHRFAITLAKQFPYE